MKKIVLYTGKGAYMAKDVEDFLSRHNFDYDRLHEIDIQKNKLKNYGILIIGGGVIYDILPAIGGKGIKNIQEFVKRGGKYIGICAGTYIASRFLIDSKGKKYKGLGLVLTEFKRGKGEKKVSVNFPLCGEKINLYYCNGPLIKKLSKEDLLVAADRSRQIGIIRKDYGRGIVYLFCGHPEGNLCKNISSKDLGSGLFFKKLLIR